MKLSKWQKRVIRFAASDKKLCCAFGSTRAGKSYAVAMSVAIHCANHGAGRIYVIAGVSAANAYINIGQTFLDMLRSMGCTLTGQPSSGMVYATVTGGRATIRFMGAADATARGRIQGYTLGGLVIDEVVLVAKDFVSMGWSRLSLPESKAWYTANPGGPRNHIKTHVVDRIDDLNGILVDFPWGSNPTIDDDVYDSLAAGLHGHERQRLIHGIWAAAQGLIWPRWSVCGPDDVPRAPVYGVGMDWGASSTTAAILFASESVRGQRWPDRSVAVGEYIHKAMEDQTLTDAEQFARMDAWLRESTGDVSRDKVTIYVDPALPIGFQLLLRRAGYAVRDAFNEVLPGLATTDARLSSGNIRLLDDACRHLEAELSMYSWDERATERGDDAPSKTDDHAADALRYFAHSTARRSSLDEWADAFAT